MKLKPCFGYDTSVCTILVFTDPCYGGFFLIFHVQLVDRQVHFCEAFLFFYLNILFVKLASTLSLLKQTDVKKIGFQLHSPMKRRAVVQLGGQA